MALVLLALFVAVPVGEIAVFIAVGSRIGVLPTIALVLLTAALGIVLVRRQGLATLRRARADLEADRVPAGAMADGLAILLAGALLVIPGFLTDIAGLLLLIPPLRARIVAAAGAWLAARAVVVGPDGVVRRPGGRADAGNVIDLEATEVEEEPRRVGSDAGSPWRRDGG